jgi:hypothetical protein
VQQLRCMYMSDVLHLTKVVYVSQARLSSLMSPQPLLAGL